MDYNLTINKEGCCCRVLQVSESFGDIHKSQNINGYLRFVFAYFNEILATECDIVKGEERNLLQMSFLLQSFSFDEPATFSKRSSMHVSIYKIAILINVVIFFFQIGVLKIA